MALDRSLEAGCIVIQIDGEARSDTVQETLERQGYFTEVISQPDFKPADVGVYLIGWEKGCVAAVALGVKQGMAVSSGRRIRFDNVCVIPPVAVAEIFPDSEAGRALAVSASNSNVVKIRKINTNKILDNIVDMYPDSKADVQHIVDIVNGGLNINEDNKSQSFSMQRDALGTSLEIFAGESCRKEVLRQWSADTYDNNMCFLEGLSQEYLREDPMIIHDTEFFDGWIAAGKVNAHTRKFIQNDKALYVVMANRTAIEASLGVDLVYLKREDDTYCFVQYKRLTKEKSGKYTYRPSSDGNYKAEYGKIHNANAQLNKIKPNKSFDSYRAFESPFLFKFCRSLVLEQLKTNLVDGFYIPFDLWKLFCRDGEKGARGAVVVDQGKVKKYLSNEEFCSFFSKGLIGTHPNSVSAITDVIKQALENGRSIVLSVEELDVGAHT